MGHIKMAKVFSFLFSAMILTSALGLSGCQQPQTLPTPRLVYTCPRIVEYSPSFLQSAHAEFLASVAKLPASSQLLSDYASLREAIRVCQSDAKAAAPVQAKTQK